MNRLLALTMTFLTLSAPPGYSLDLPGHPSMNSLEIVSETMQCTDCIDWKLLGVCVWLQCSLSGCSVRESIKVEHFIPDLVVASYTTKSVYKETDSLNPTPVSAISSTDSAENDETPLDFKNVDIFSNPSVVAVNEVLAQTEFFCRTPLTVPLMPYFLSGLDYFWRDATLERLLPRTWLNPTRIETGVKLPVIGAGYWANEYPRNGFGNHLHDPINAAVAAHRAVHIVSRSGQMHVYQHADGDCPDRCWAPAPLSADPEDEGYEDNRFQMLYPEVEDEANPFGGPVSWVNGKINTHETYLWSVWRKYQCCTDRGMYITTIDLEE